MTASEDASTADQRVDDHVDDEGIVDESVSDDEGLYETPESTLPYFGADFDVRGLVQRLKDGDIVIPRFDPDESDGASLAGFQRQRVWSKSKMEQFIESLLLGWPVPSIFLVLDEDQRYLVLDGQQRLTALDAFTSGEYPDGSPFKLNEVAAHLKNATYETLDTESKRKFNNTFIQATIIEPKGNAGRESVYRLFGRLNSGGMALTAQEIRVALFLGPVVDWIRELNKDPNWRALYGNRSPRLKDQELILRILAMEKIHSNLDGEWSETDTNSQIYTPPMSEFLNKYLDINRHLQEIDQELLSSAFKAATKSLYTTAGQDGLRLNGRINSAHVDAVMSAIMWLNETGKAPDSEKIASALAGLRSSSEYVEFVTRSTSHKENVYGRLQLAVNALS